MPGAVALQAEEEILTYGELDRQSNRLAHHLRSFGVGPNTLVGLCLPRSVDIMIGALAILKAGGAFVPMDPAYPADRLAFMLEDAHAPVLITNEVLARRLPTAKCSVVYAGDPAVADYPDRAPRVDIVPSDLAYVIYTSGSTGAPKGVEITHASLSNLVGWHCEAFCVTAADRATSLAGLGFDAAVWEIWPYLASGASIHLVDDLTRNSADFLRDWLLAQRITISFVPTPVAEHLLMMDWPADTPMRVLLTGGDTLHHYPPRHLPFTLVNNYGPTEFTVVATSGVIPPDSRADFVPPIGRAISNAQIHLLDENLTQVDEGTPGEIHIGGAGLARGYHNRPDLTAERFIPNPFSSEPGDRLYKTGDLARRLPDGQFEFLGRVDDQIKIRGYRVEPNEIVAAMNRHPAVRESLVLAREDVPGDKRLVAYIVLNPNTSVTTATLRDSLRDRLPEYMLPSMFIRLEQFPLTPHGKIDRAALPAPDTANMLLDETPVDSRTPVEQRVTEVVCGLLHRNDVNLDDNFFLLGGHSMLGAQLIARLRDAFKVQIALRTLFRSPTVRVLSAEIERLNAAANAPGQLAPPESASVAISGVERQV